MMVVIVISVSSMRNSSKSLPLKALLLFPQFEQFSSNLTEFFFV